MIVAALASLAGVTVTCTAIHLGNCAAISLPNSGAQVGSGSALVARRVTDAVDVPTIGIGAGQACDGQVLVYHDLLGLAPGKSPKFVRRYADLFEASVDAIRHWSTDVREGTFPGPDETY